MEIVKSNIANALTSAAKDHVLGVANDIYDESQEKYQSEINKELLDNANNNNADINEFHEVVDKIIDTLYIIDAPNNLEKLESIKITLNTLGDGYKNVVELATTLKSFITNTDATNETINSWKEIENFLQGVTDTETLTGLLEELKTGIESKITEINNKLAEYKVKDVDGLSTIVDENGIVKVNYNTDKHFLLNNNVVTGSPITVKLNDDKGFIYPIVNAYIYNGNRELAQSSQSLVQEKALYKHITELKDIIPNLKIFDIEFGDGDYQYIFDYLAEDAENFKNVVFKLYATNNTYLLTIYQYHHNTDRIETNTYTHPTNGIYNIIITPTNVTGQRILITDNFFNPTTINANILKGGTLSESKFDYNLKTKFNNINQSTIDNADAIEALTTTVNNNSNIINTFLDELNNDNLTDNNYQNLLTLLGITADAETVSSLITKFNALGSEYSTIYKIAKTLHDFLNDIDASDTTINRWTEIKNFLNGITDDKDLLGIINDSISNNNKNYYTKEEIDAAIKPFVDNGFTVLHFENGSNVNCQKLIDILNNDQNNLAKVIGVFKYTNNDNVSNFYISNINHNSSSSYLYSNVFMSNIYNDLGVYELFKFRIDVNDCTRFTCKMSGSNLSGNTVTFDKLENSVKDKINAIPDLAIFTLTTNNTNLINYIAEHGYQNVLVKVDNNIVSLYNETTTNQFITNKVLCYWTFTETTFIKHVFDFNGYYITKNSINPDKLNPVIQDKLNSIPNIRIFKLSKTDNSAIFDAWDEDPTNIFVKVKNHRNEYHILHVAGYIADMDMLFVNHYINSNNELWFIRISRTNYTEHTTSFNTNVYGTRSIRAIALQSYMGLVLNKTSEYIKISTSIPGTQKCHNVYIKGQNYYGNSKGNSINLDLSFYTYQNKLYNCVSTGLDTIEAWAKINEDNLVDIYVRNKHNLSGYQMNFIMYHDTLDETHDVNNNSFRITYIEDITEFDDTNLTKFTFWNNTPEVATAEQLQTILNTL